MAQDSSTPSGPRGNLRRAVGLFRQHWQPVAFVGGAALLAFALGFWQGPVRTWRKREIYRDFATARDFYEAGDSIDALPLLQKIEPQLWRTENLRGEVYYLLGAVNNELADEAVARDSVAYRASGLHYLREADEVGVPAAYSLELEDRLGQALLAAGEHQEGLAAQEIALRERRQLQAVLLRRSAQAAMSEEPPDFATASQLVRQWSQLPNLSDAERQQADEAAEWVEADDEAGLKAYLDDPERQWLADDGNPAIFQIDLQSWIDLTLEGPEAAHEYLRQQTSHNNEAMSDLLARMAAANLRKPRPDYQAALELGEQRLALPGLAPREMDDARLRQADALLALGDLSRARDVLRQVAPDGPQGARAKFLLAQSYYQEASRIEGTSTDEWLKVHPGVDATFDALGRMLLPSRHELRPGRIESAWRSAVANWIQPATAKNFVSENYFFKAIGLFEELAADPLSNESGDRGPGQLMLGTSYLRVDKSSQAKQEYERAIKAFPSSDIERAARFLLADALLALNDPGALAALEKAVASARRQIVFHNQYFPLSDLRGLFARFWQRSHAAGRYPEAIAIAKLYEEYSEPGVAAQMLADSARAQADLLSGRAGTESGEQAAKTLAEAASLYREAGDAYAKVAAVHETTLDYADDLWQAALAYSEGRAFQEVIDTIERFLVAHGQGSLDFSARLLMARALMDQEKFVRARETLEEALRREPRSPNRFEGRLRLAQCCIEIVRAMGPDESEEAAAQRKALLAEAEENLRKNTDGLDLDLDPAAIAWRRSLFELGTTLLLMGNYDDGIARLREAYRRYPRDPKSWEARYAVGNAYFESAKQPAEQLEKEDAPRRRAKLQAEKTWRLTQAADMLKQLQRDLLERQQQQPLTPQEALIAQNSALRIGDAYFELGDWPTAIEAYTTVANRYQDKPASLAAYVKIAFANWNMDRDAEARGAIRQALWALDRMPDEAFTGADLSKETWTQQLNGLISDL